jgi:hypothetical protein
MMVSRVEKNADKLQLLYNLGYEDAERSLTRFDEWAEEESRMVKL